MRNNIFNYVPSLSAIASSQDAQGTMDKKTSGHLENLEGTHLMGSII